MELGTRRVQRGSYDKGLYNRHEYLDVDRKLSSALFSEVPCSKMLSDAKKGGI